MTKSAPPQTPTGNCVIVRQVWDRIEIFDGEEIYLGSHDTHAEALAAAKADAESEGVPFVDLTPLLAMTN